MFDCRTNRTPIERLGSIGFDWFLDWFLVRFRSIDYAGLLALAKSIYYRKKFSCRVLWNTSLAITIDAGRIELDE